MQKKKKIYHTLQSKFSEGFKICCKSIKNVKKVGHTYTISIYVTEIVPCGFLCVTKIMDKMCEEERDKILLLRIEMGTLKDIRIWEHTGVSHKEEK